MLEGSRAHVMLAVILELLGRDGGAEEILQVLQHVLLRRGEGARLGVLIERGLAGGRSGSSSHGADGLGLLCKTRRARSVRRLAGRCGCNSAPSSHCCIAEGYRTRSNRPPFFKRCAHFLPAHPDTHTHARFFFTRASRTRAAKPARRWARRRWGPDRPPRAGASSPLAAASPAATPGARS